MTSRDSCLKAFGGGNLEGDRWVRILYLDESGIGKIDKDPILVVAGVVIHADTQWGPLANSLDNLLAEAVPLGAKRPRFLHAKDIWHGSGEFPRNVWDQERRNKLLAEIGSLVAKHSLPVVWSASDRKKYAREQSGEPESEHLRTIYTINALSCFMQTEAYLRQSHNDAEVCSVMMEQNHELQKRIPEMVAFLRDPGEETKNLLEGWQSYMPLRKIIDTPSCQPKTASSILQLADYCAFAIKRRLQGSAGSVRLTSPLADNLLRYGNSRLWGAASRGVWNPIHMPSAWPYPMKLEGGQFVKVEKGC